MYLDYYLMGIILIPGIILALYAQAKVNNAYKKYSTVYAKNSLTASELIKRLLISCEMSNIRVNQISGELTDHYNPSTEEICLSNGVYSSNSISALGIACHEFGHALQKKEKYVPYQIRKILVPITNFASRLLWPLVFIGLLLNLGVGSGGLAGDVFLWCGIGFFGISVLFNLATLPVEFDASNRALKILSSTNTLDEEELEGTKKVLNAAALTYIAAFVVSLLNLLRFLLVIFVNRNRD